MKRYFSQMTRAALGVASALAPAASVQAFPNLDPPSVAGDPYLLALDVCVHEAPHEIVTPSTSELGTLTAAQYVEGQLALFSDQFFEATQGAIRVDAVNVSYGSSSCNGFDVDWQILPPQDCVEQLQPDSNGDLPLWQCSWARMTYDPRPLEEYENNDGRIACDHRTDPGSIIRIVGSSSKQTPSEQTSGLPDYGAEILTHELGHYAFCLVDAYPSELGEDFSTPNAWMHSAFLYNWFVERRWWENLRYVFVDQPDMTTIMNDHHMTQPFSNASYNFAINDCRDPDPNAACHRRSPYGNNPDTCLFKYSDHETKDQLVLWDQTRPAGMPDTKDQLANQSHYDRDEWWQVMSLINDGDPGNDEIRMLVSTFNSMPFMFADWDIIEREGPAGPSYDQFNPGRNVQCKPLQTLESELSDGTLPEPAVLGIDMGDPAENGTYVLLDVSGSMGAYDSDTMKTAAQMAQDAGRYIFQRAQEDLSFTRNLGIAVYSDDVQQQLSYQQHAAVDLQGSDVLGNYVSHGGFTDIEKALRYAAAQVVAVHGNQAPGTDIYLMSDGRQTTGCGDGCEFDRAEQIWNDHQISIDALGFGNTNQDAMQALAKGAKRSRSTAGVGVNALHRMKLAVVNQYSRARGQQQLLAEQGPYTTVTAPINNGEDAVVWHERTLEVPEGSTKLSISAYPRAMDGSTLFMAVRDPNGQQYGVGMGENETMNTGDFVGLNIPDPVPGTYELVFGSLGYYVPGGVVSAFDDPFDLQAWATVEDVDARVWTADTLLNGNEITEVGVHGRVHAPHRLTGLTASLDVILEDGQIAGSFQMLDDGLGRDERADDGIYSAAVPVAVLGSTEHFTVRGHFHVPSTATPVDRPEFMKSNYFEYNRGTFDIAAEADLAINFGSPSTYRADIDLSTFGGGAVEQGGVYVGTIRVRNAAPSVDALGISLGSQIHLDYVERVDVDGDDGVYNVGFNVDEAALYGPRDLRVSFGDLTRRVEGYLDVVEQGEGDMGSSDTETVLEPTADSSVRIWLANTAHGTDTLLHVGSNEVQNWDRSLVRFDSAQLTNAVAQSHLRSAMLELRVYNQDGDWTPGTRLAAHEVLYPWKENSVTWNCADDYATWNLWEDCTPANRWRMGGPSTRKDGYDPVAATSREVSAFGGGVVSIDVTPLVRKWLDSPADNHGLALAILKDPSAEWINFYSSESAYSPKLRVKTY